MDPRDAQRAIATQLRGVDLFGALPDDALMDLAAHVESRRYQRGERVFTEGDPGLAVYFVLSGRVKVFRTAPDGVEYILRVWHAGQTFGTIVLLQPTVYPASAEALTDAVVGSLPVQEYERLATAHPALRARAGGIVAERVLLAQRKAEHMARDSGQARVIRALLEIAGPGTGERTGGATPGTRGATPGTIVTATHYDLAQATGLSRETVSRLMVDLRRDGLVQPAGAGRLALNLDKLRQAVRDAD